MVLILAHRKCDTELCVKPNEYIHVVWMEAAQLFNYLLLYVNKSFLHMVFCLFSLVYLFISRIIVVKLISPRSLCCTRQAFSTLSRRGNLFGWFWQKGNKIPGFVFVIDCKGKKQCRKSAWFQELILKSCWVTWIEKTNNFYFKIFGSLKALALLQLSTKHRT